MTLQQLGDRQVNAVFKLSDMPKYFKDFIDARLASANRDYIYEAQYSWDNDTKKVFGLEVIKDYYKQINLVYKARDNEFRSVAIADIWNSKEVDTSRYITTDIETPQQSKYDHIIKDLLKDNYEVVHDYDAQSIMDALELGDMSMLCDIVGDRDIAELI